MNIKHQLPIIFFNLIAHMIKSSNPRVPWRFPRHWKKDRLILGKTHET
jgi:hypothetical protein